MSLEDFITKVENNEIELKDATLYFPIFTLQELYKLRTTDNKTILQYAIDNNCQKVIKNIKEGLNITDELSLLREGYFNYHNIKEDGKYNVHYDLLSQFVPDSTQDLKDMLDEIELKNTNNIKESSQINNNNYYQESSKELEYAKQEYNEAIKNNDEARIQYWANIINQYQIKENQPNLNDKELDNLYFIERMKALKTILYINNKDKYQDLINQELTWNKEDLPTKYAEWINKNYTIDSNDIISLNIYSLLLNIPIEQLQQQLNNNLSR